MNGNCVGPLFLAAMLFIVALCAISWLLKGAGPSRNDIIKAAYKVGQEYGQDTEGQFEVLDETKLAKDDYIIGWKAGADDIRDMPVIVHGAASDRWTKEDNEKQSHW